MLIIYPSCEVKFLAPHKEAILAGAKPFSDNSATFAPNDDVARAHGIGNQIAA